MAAEALNCPNCGAGVESDRSECQFCRTRLKTVGCPKCLGLMFVGSKFCQHCGAIAAPVELSLEGDTGECPRCRVALERLQVDETAFNACTKCDGIWVGVQTFEAICADHERQSAVLTFLDSRTQRSVPLTKVNYVPCPNCGELMNRNNFAKASGVIVDICKPHGVWFDSDELPAIIEFIRKGGMEMARQRERDALTAERNKLRDDQRCQAAMDRKYGTGNVFDDTDESGVRGFIRSLFQ